MGRELAKLRVDDSGLLAAFHVRLPDGAPHALAEQRRRARVDGDAKRCRMPPSPARQFRTAGCSVLHDASATFPHRLFEPAVERRRFADVSRRPLLSECQGRAVGEGARHAEQLLLAGQGPARCPKRLVQDDEVRPEEADRCGLHGRTIQDPLIRGSLGCKVKIEFVPA